MLLNLKALHHNAVIVVDSFVLDVYIILINLDVSVLQNHLYCDIVIVMSEKRSPNNVIRVISAWLGEPELLTGDVDIDGWSF